MVEHGLSRTRSQAREAILRGAVALNGVPATRAGQPVPTDARVTAEPVPFVSRGGHKLAHALDHFAIDASGQTALDVGASTGGFTDVLLRRGAAAVAALDVGHGQLAPALAADPRVHVLDGRNARRLAPGDLPFAPDIVAVDVSFISLTLVLPAVLPLAAPAARLLALVKPQFEVGRAAVGKGGIVRDQAAVAEALERVRSTVEAAGFAADGTVPSPIRGGDGNAEFLIAAHRVR